MDAYRDFTEYRSLNSIATRSCASFALVSLEPAIEIKPPLGERLAVRFWELWAALYAPNARPTSASL